MELQPTGEQQLPASNVSKEESLNPNEGTRIANAQGILDEDTTIELPGEKQASKSDDAAEDGTAEPEPPFSIFSRGEKTFIIIMASLAALFSPLSANIYYPALTVLAEDLKTSNTLINLTITSYLVGRSLHYKSATLMEKKIFQGLAPTFVGSISDETGRRPSYILCFVVYISACIGLALQNNYAALFVLRCLQSSGSSGTVALANAVVADIVTSAERGTYIGYVTVGALAGPAFGPVIGGKSQYLG